MTTNLDDEWDDALADFFESDYVLDDRIKPPDLDVAVRPNE